MLAAFHAALDSAHRKTLVSVVRGRVADRPDGGKSEAPVVHDGGGAPGPGDAERLKRRLAQLTRELDLDAAQQKRVEPSPRQGFPGPPPPSTGPSATWRSSPPSSATRSTPTSWSSPSPPRRRSTPSTPSTSPRSSPILKPEQREKLAAGMERHRGGHPGRDRVPRPRGPRSPVATPDRPAWSSALCSGVPEIQTPRIAFVRRRLARASGWLAFAAAILPVAAYAARLAPGAGRPDPPGHPRSRRAGGAPARGPLVPGRAGSLRGGRIAPARGRRSW